MYLLLSSPIFNEQNIHLSVLITFIIACESTCILPLKNVEIVEMLKFE